MNERLAFGYGTAGSSPPRWGGPTHAAQPAVVTKEEALYLDAHASAMTAAVVGWFICALFASVAYSWTFYYLLALAVAPRDILGSRLAARAARKTSRTMEARA